ncbi:MAG: HAMP domain-containing protein [Pirellulales bacterium]|nr:HAMP domain-containing protein [Pirellulales bacterium]
MRLTIWNTAVVLLAVVLALLGVRNGLRVSLVRETDQLLLDEADEVGLAIRQLHPNLEAIEQQMNRTAVGHKELGWFLQLVDDRDETFFSSVDTPAEMLNLHLPREAAAVTAVGPYRVAQRLLTGPNMPGYAVRVGTSLDFVERDVSRLTRLLVPLGIVLTALSPLGGYWLATRATSPLANVLSTARRLRPSNLGERLPLRGTGDELDQLSVTINRFLDRIANYVQQQREFVDNAAHELRSPLAAIQGSVDVALNSDRSVEEYQELLYSVIEECSELRLLVNHLLQLTESDNDSDQSTHENVALDEVVGRSLEMFRGAAEERNIELESGLLCPAPVRGHAVQLRQVVNNLLENALKFTPPGGRVRVTLARAGDDKIALTVADSGIGISAADLPHIFERFYQADRARQRQTSASRGHGLGLSICQAVIHGHGGSIDARSVLDQGTTFRVVLPLMHAERRLATASE